MAEITAKQVMELRQKTGCGMMECKKALVENNGDVEGAIESLRKAGVAKAQKRAGRSATQGKWAVAVQDGVYALVEMLCETDFVAKTAEFKALADAAAAKAASYGVDGDVSEKLAADMDADVKALIGKIGENMHLRRAVAWKPAAGNQIGYYLHTAQPFAALVEVAGPCDAALLKNISLHITANNPSYISRDDVPAAIIEKETEIARSSDRLKGKPEKALANIIKGMLDKNLFQANCLMEQPWIDDDKTSLAKLAPNVKVVRFIRWMAGEELAEK